MNNIRNILILCFISLLSLSAATQISEGDVSGTWTQANSPYHVNGNIDIPMNSTLTIEPGTDIYFTDQYEFNVHGQLIAEGTETDSIFFHADSLGSQDAWPYYTGFWYGITFHATDSTNQDASVLKYCKVSYAYKRWLDTGNASRVFNRVFGGGLIFYKSKIDISNTRIDHSLKGSNAASICAIYSSGLINSTSIVDAAEVELLNSDVDIINSHFEQSNGIALKNSTSNIINTKFLNGYTGISAEYSDVNVLNCKINNNIGGGLGISYSTINLLRTNILQNAGGISLIESPATIINCNISNNTGNGLYSTSSTTWVDTTFMADIQNTIVAQNGGYGMFFKYNNGANIKNCVIADNEIQEWQAGIRYQGETMDVTVTNSIVYNNGNHVDPQVSGAYHYCIVQGTAPAGAYDSTTAALQDHDPLFRDDANGDYRLKTTESTYFYNSPGIDAGDPEISDWLLDTETAGLATSRSDIGAYGGANNWWNTDLLPPCHFKGDVSGVWSCDKIYVDGDIFVPEGDTLEIMPSVDWVLFSGPYEIKVEGVLIARGTEEREIKFQGGSGAGIEWHGIVFNAINTRTSGASILEYCRFDYANKIGTHFPNGGAVCIYNSDNVTVKDCYFYNNNARLGGAVYIELSNPRIESCIFKVNGREHSDDIDVLTSAGGAMYIKSSTPVMHDLKFSHNAANDGAAIFLEQSSPKISNTLFAENHADGFAGAIFISNSSPHIVNMTSAENTALAGGSFSLASTSSHPTVINSIMYGNSKPEIYLNDGTPTVTYSIIDSAGSESYFGTGCLTDDPMLTDNDSYYLTYTNQNVSPAVDAGHPDSIDTFIGDYAGRGETRADMGYYGGRLFEVNTSAIDDNIATIEDFKLESNYPNPFNPMTNIPFELPENAQIELEIYNLSGQKVQTLVQSYCSQGSYQYTWNAQTLPSGIYMAVLRVNAQIADTKKMALIK